MGDVDDEAFLALNPDRVRIGGVGDADEHRPLGADGMFGGFAADPMLREDGFDQTDEGLSRAFFGTARLVKRDAAEIADQFLGETTEGLGVYSHGVVEFDAGLRRGGCSGRKRRKRWPTRCKNRGNRRGSQV